MERRRVPRRLGVAALLAVAVAQAAVSRAATLQKPTTIRISGTAVALAVVSPVPESCEFTLEGQWRSVEQDFLFRDPEYTAGTCYLVVRSNVPLVLSLEGEGVTVASNSYPATYEWSLASGSDGTLERAVCVLPKDSPCRFYSSMRPVRNDRINLGDFYILYADPVASGPLEGRIVVLVSPVAG